ncbi:MAG: efflux RND transporter periplasmic adaptor subunit [Deltaproteobacteria bacterium]
MSSSSSTPVYAPIAVILFALGAAFVLVKTSSRPQRTKRPPKPALVEVIDVAMKDRATTVSAMGTIVPAQMIQLRPEVQGRVVRHADALVPGGVVKKGDTLVRIDAREYQLALDQARSAVLQNETQLKLEEGRREVASREWKLVGDPSKSTATGRSLALREPQLASAKAAVASAKSSVERAQLNVDRTTVRAPFNAMVKEEAVEVGQLVGPTTNLATLVGTDSFWVQVSVPVAELRWIDVPGVGGGEGARASIVQEVGKTPVERQGRVIRLLGELDPKGRMARLLVEVKDPLGLETKAEDNLPLLLGAYVRVDIEGRTLPRVAELPRRALRDGNAVWIAAPDDTLRIQDVHVSWRGRDVVFVDRGLNANDRVIASRLAMPIVGMAIRTSDSEDKAEPPTAARPANQPAHEATP